MKYLIKLFLFFKENINGYRLYLITKLPQLKHINFSGISKAEKQTAKTFMQTQGKLKPLDDDSEKKPVKKVIDDDE